MHETVCEYHIYLIKKYYSSTMLTTNDACTGVVKIRMVNFGILINT